MFSEQNNDEHSCPVPAWSGCVAPADLATVGVEVTPLMTSCGPCGPGMGPVPAVGLPGPVLFTADHHSPGLALVRGV